MLLVPTLFPFSFHWYEGVAPPFVGVAVNVAVVPEQIVFPGLAAMLTDGVTDPDTDIVIAFDVAVVGLAQASDEVITTVTTSPFTSPEF